MDNSNQTRLAFAAIDKTVVENIPLPKEVNARGREFVYWGERNKYPEYLLSLFENVTTLRSIITGTVDFIVGDDVTLGTTLWPGGAINRRGETIRDIVKAVAQDWEIFHGFALEVIRREDLTGVAEINHLDMRYVRTNKDADVFFYSEKFGEDYVRERDIVTLPKFMRDGKHPASVVFVKGSGAGVYPTPVYAAAVKACEIERSIDDYHLNAINNGFSGSYIVNFNNGVPQDKIKSEMERNFIEKFSGQKNAGRVVLCWNDSVTSQTTLQKLELQDFGEKYKALADHSRQQIFAAFRATPNLFGIPTETTGFSEQEFSEAFRLYNRTVVQPVQRIIADTFEKVLGIPGVLTIKPFSLDGAGEDNIQ